MPDTLYRNESTRFPPGTNPSGVSWGIRTETYQNGFKTRPNERKSQVLEYTGRRMTGSSGRILLPPTSLPTVSRVWVAPNYYSPYVRGTSTDLSFADAVRNRAYEKFKDVALGDGASLGVFAAEARESYGMVANRVIGLRNAYSALRKGDFRRFLRELKTKPKRKHRNKIRATSTETTGLWLEYWFGWSPTVQDIFAAVETINKDLKENRYFGASGCYYPERFENNYPPPTSSARADRWGDAFVIYKTGATIQLDNPNLFLASQLGLINPAAIAWELVPFSFVVDWFTKLGNVIEAQTDFVGLTLIDPYQTSYARFTNGFRTWNKNSVGYSGEFNYRLFRMVRKKGLIKPVVLWPKFANFGRSKTRAATAVSLLTQLFLAK